MNLEGYQNFDLGNEFDMKCHNVALIKPKKLEKLD